MTYKLNSIVEKIMSPIILRFADHDLPEREYSDGRELAAEQFDRSYTIESIAATGNSVCIVVRESDAVNDTLWIQDNSEISFF